MSKKEKNQVPEENTQETEKTEAKVTVETAAEAATAEPAEAPAEEKPDEAEQLKKQLADEKDKYLRLMAEYDNFRKRSARERENIYSDAKADTLDKIFPVYDNLELALKQETSDEAYRKGVELIMNQFVESLKVLGVTPIEAVGQTFDPALHNAVMHTEDPEKGENEVVQEFKKGFKMGDKVIRFSMVQVAN